MKIYLRDLNSIKYKKYFVFGSDEEAVLYAEQELLMLCRTQQGANSVIRFDYKEVKDNITILQSELNSSGLFDDAKVIIVNNVSGQINKSFLQMLENINPKHYLLIIGGDQKPQSTLRKLAESAKDILAIACYKDEPRDLIAYVQKLLNAANIQYVREVPEMLIASLPPSRRAIAMEIEKITLALDSNNLCTELLEELMHDLGEINLETMFSLVVNQNIDSMMSIIHKAFAEDVNFMIIIRGLLRQFTTLEKLLLLIDKGESAEQSANKLGLFFKIKPLYLQAVQKINISKLHQWIKRLCQLELACKSTGANVQLLITKEIVEMMV